MREVREKRIKKYVIVKQGQPTTYLRSLRHGNYCFVEDIEGASKTLSRSLAKEIVNNYYYDSGVTTDVVEQVVIPVVITYDQVDESNDFGGI